MLVILASIPWLTLLLHGFGHNLVQTYNRFHLFPKIFKVLRRQLDFQAWKSKFNFNFLKQQLQ